MNDFDSEEFRFEIKAFSPETIPMERLAQYMAVFAKLLANTQSVHFKELQTSSTVLVARADREAIPKVVNRINSVKLAEAPRDAIEAIDAANDMLRDDNATGRILHGQQAQVIYLPGREIPRPKKIGPFTETASVKGELVRLEGEDATKHAGIRDAQGRVWSGDMPLEVAVQMRQYLFDWVQVDGTARWVRNENGKWEMRSFHIHSCRVLPKDSLETDVKKLRKVPGNAWTDASGIIRESRNEDDELH